VIKIKRTTLTLIVTYRLCLPIRGLSLSSSSGPIPRTITVGQLRATATLDSKVLAAVFSLSFYEPTKYTGGFCDCSFGCPSWFWSPKGLDSLSKVMAFVTLRRVDWQIGRCWRVRLLL